MASLELQLKSGRGSLKLIRKDIYQIHNVGKSAVDKTEPDLTPNFLAMHPAASDLKSQYMTDFLSYFNLAILEGKDSLFPTEDDIKQRNEINSFYYKIVEFHQEITKRLNNSLLNNSKIEDSNKSIINQSLARSRLPRVELPKFSGRIGDWPKFKQLFESIIDSNADIPTIEKYHYLSTCVVGEAKSLIASFTIDDENYLKAWEVLCKRFDNKRLLATSYVDKILDFNPLQGPQSLQALQSFISNIGENVAALKSVGIENEADFIWLTLALRKLDSETRKQFEIHSVEIEWPTFSSFIEFLHGRCRVLQLADCRDVPRPSRSVRSSSKPFVLSTSTSTTPSIQAGTSTCRCSSSHPLYQCPIFRSRSPRGRKSFLKGKHICCNCLKFGHVVSDCTHPGRCQTCQGKHNTLLHYSNFQAKQTPSDTNASPPARKDTSATENIPSVVASVMGPTQVLLGTAEAFILDANNIPQPIRLVVDCCSQFSLITTTCARRLGLNWRRSGQKTLGVGGTPLPKTIGKLRCKLTSRLHPDKSFIVEPLVVGSVTGSLPSSPLKPINNMSQFNFDLADRRFWEPRPTDFLLGGDLFMKIITGSPTSLNETYQALPTVFGLVVMGPTGVSSTPDFLYCHCIAEAPLDNDILLRFWETEDVSLAENNQDHDPCEEHFTQTHYRDESGRYVLALPFKNSPEDLKESTTSAPMQYAALERKMTKNPELFAKYQAFLQEYLTLGHMSLASTPSTYIIPHHGVFKSKDPASKIRVVFNASAPTSKGSLNDHLHIGPKLQQDLTIIILNFRRHPIAVTADLVKMYRQILIRPEDRRFQHILWRPAPDMDVLTFELNTVTYGVASAPYQALRTIKQLVMDEGESFPLAAKVLSEDIYVDDIVTGADTIEEATRLRAQLVEILEKAKFEIHKWASNSLEFIGSLNTKDHCLPLTLSPRDACFTKILGMSWDPIRDTFFYQLGSINPGITKRNILSVIARLYDPMGYLAPVTFKAKTVLQMLWSSRLDWDERPGNDISREWLEFSTELHKLQQLQIPRYVHSSGAHCLQLLGFCDASQKGFAAVLYLRVIPRQGPVKISLLKAKTKLAPLKTISIPRLELSAAHLLVKLILSVKPFLNPMNISSTILFSDSTIVLSWLKISPHMLQTFVGNRVSFIISNTDAAQWHHIASECNPADVASRGLPPSLLRHHILWWAGPTWLQNHDWIPSSPPDFDIDIPELKSGVSFLINSELPSFISWMSTFSNYQHMLRVLAYVQRFIYNSGKPDRRLSGILSGEELNQSLSTCIKIVQAHEFAQEFSWSKNCALSKRLRILDASVDANGILRVGGRLHNADLSYETKFPIILPGKCSLVKLMISHLHNTHYHLGFQALQALIRRRFWIFRLRQTINSQLHKCLTCFKLRTRPQNPFMGSLPSSRVRPSRPFSASGVDYAGPFSIKLSTRRNATTSKAYLAVFVCLSTRAVHLELVSSLTTDAFLAALDRFVARRGLPSTMYSDCGTNFIGAERRLTELFTWINEKDTKDKLHNHALAKGFQWNFNPPLAPHFGGIWEAAVKSAKRHLYRVTKDHHFNFEELTTMFSRIEAILNSRPLCPMQNDTSQGDVLTPGHFLIGAPLLAIPEKDHTEIPVGRLTRWQLVTNATQHFWKRWHGEYLQSLQKRPKWYQHTKPLKIGDLIVLPDSRSAVQHWRYARIADVHPGEDGIVRVVTIKDGQGLYKRSVNKIVSLSHLQEP